jgi:XrtJ-associated TM-motif-TM protein
MVKIPFVHVLRQLYELLKVPRPVRPTNAGKTPSNKVRQGPTMKNFFQHFTTAVTLLSFGAIAAHAQGFGGCGESPENPTLVLAGLASGAFAVSQVKMRLRARRKGDHK